MNNDLASKVIWPHTTVPDGVPITEFLKCAVGIPGPVIPVDDVIKLLTSFECSCVYAHNGVEQKDNQCEVCKAYEKLRAIQERKDK